VRAILEVVCMLTGARSKRENLPTRTARARSTTTKLVALCACAAHALACGSPLVTLDLVDGTLELAATEPALLDESRTLVAAMFDSSTAPCDLLLDMDVTTLAATSAAQAGAAAQAFTLENDAQCETETHVFGRVDEPKRYSYLMLGSTLPCGENFANVDDDIAASQGSVIAIGCRERDIAAGETVQLRITLFPAGLR
jgi:hypothetical protein